MINLQLSNVVKCLEEELPQLDFQASEVTMILLDKNQVVPFFYRYKNKGDCLQAEVYGFSIYHYSFFDLRLLWKVEAVDYEGVHGVNLNSEQVQIVDIELLNNNKLVRLCRQNVIVDEAQSLSILKKPFDTFLQDWKLYPFLSANGMQPTHYKVKKELLAGVKVDDIVEVQYKTYPQLRTDVVERGGYELINSFFDSVVVENNLVCMEGFSCYRLGKKEDACIAHLHWLVRGSWENASQFEVAIVESDSLPGAFFTGVNLTDNLDEGRDILAIMRLLKHEQGWKRESVELLRNWLQDNSQEKSVVSVDLEALNSISDGKNIPAHQENKVQLDASKKMVEEKSPMQLDLFGEATDPYEYRRYTVLNGSKKLDFSGLRIGRVVDKENPNGEINIFDLYKTDGNRLIGVKRQVSSLDSPSSDSSEAEYLSNKTHLFNFFGNDVVAKNLYEQAQCNKDQQDE